MQAYELVKILSDALNRLSKIGIMNYYHVEKDSEEEAYLLGYIVQKVVQKLNADGFGERNWL